MGTSSTSKFFEENMETLVSSDGRNQMYSEEYMVSSIICSDSDGLLLSTLSLEDEAAAVAYTTIPSEWIDYIDGVLQNVGYCDYIAYGYIDSEGLQNYVLVYDLQIENNEIAAADYPYIRFTHSGSETGTISEVDIPYPCYGSFGTLSELREGGGINETYTILFAFGVAVVFGLVTRFFDSYKHN